MSTTSQQFYKHQDLLYKFLLIIICAGFIVYFFPKSGKFKYEIQKGFPWQYENLYADEDFAILKSADELAQEKEQIKSQSAIYYEYDQTVLNKVLALYDSNFNKAFPDTLSYSSSKLELKNYGKNLLSTFYKNGVVKDKPVYNTGRLIYLKRGNEVSEMNFDNITVLSDMPDALSDAIQSSLYSEYSNRYLQVYFDGLEANITLDEELTQESLALELSSISKTHNIVPKGSIIINRGELVEGENLQKLLSLKQKYESQNISESRYNWVLFGYVLLVLLALVMLLLFIRTYRPAVFLNNTKVTFVFFNVLLMVLLTTIVIKWSPQYVYAVPMCILPLIIKAFFDARLGLFTHVIAILLLGFIVPDSFEYFFLQVIAGIVTILTVPELYKRANLFISVGQITLIYILAYFAFHIISEGGVEGLAWPDFGMFMLAGLATLFVQPLIYIYEKMFGLVSDVSLLELSDTNSKLLKRLADEAPGTFHHSLNVANLSEAAANEIGANAMLVRVGALYHDIGKIINPTDFTENQATGINSHDDLSPKESARIIIDHVLNGIELARKYNLPDRVIDFIRTHHGTSTVQYFYFKEKEKNEDAAIEDFQYPGPLPFSKETAILMMADSVEAASKSLKNPTSTLIDAFVEKIIKKQMDEDQYLNADITFKEIQQIKKVLKKKLNNIYHLRIEYPE
ncbi:HD family protein [Dokdonia sp. MED134]|uniref:HD family phosphohydrolase n=1 Tax=Dokdonia sp. MED134 TaxID=313590 RepID=UPI000068AB4B|nr:HDIG domain-containing metalloprotein [Dokdonia sp. MED134]EAQ40160.1 HD family protein [Dokdonia sp. MED134]